MVLALSTSPRSVTVMGRLARLTRAVISSVRSAPPNFQRRPPPIASSATKAPPAQYVRLRRYQTGTLPFGFLLRDSLPVGAPVCVRVGDAVCVRLAEPRCVSADGESGCVSADGEPGCVSAGSGGFA